MLFRSNYSVHKNEIIKDIAKSYNIFLHYVPPTMTATNQPLDVKINGPVKAIGKQLAKEIFLEDPFSTPTLIDSINCLISSVKK